MAGFQNCYGSNQNKIAVSALCLKIANGERFFTVMLIQYFKRKFNFLFQTHVEILLRRNLMLILFHGKPNWLLVLT